MTLKFIGPLFLLHVRVHFALNFHANLRSYKPTSAFML